MNEQQSKIIAKFTVALVGFVDAWEEQNRRVEELQQMVAVICMGFQRQFSKEEWKLINDYGRAYCEEKKTGTPTENNS